MKNYKINYSLEHGIFGEKKVLNKQQKDNLFNLGFDFDEFFNKYSKRYYKDFVSVEMCLVPSKEYLYFYNHRFFLPCELDDYYKPLMKDIRKDVKILKEIMVLKK